MVSTNYTENMNVSSANTHSCSLPMAHGIPLILVNAIVCVLGSLGNLLVCLAIATNSRLRRASNYLLFSLAVADLIVTLISEPIYLECISRLTFFHKCRTSMEKLVYEFLVNLSCQTSFLHVASISIDRFFAVAFPLRHKILMEKGGLKIMLIASWSIPILNCVLNIIPTDSTPVTYLVGIGIFLFSGLSIFFFHFLIVVHLLYYRKKTKQLRARTVSAVRITCTLAIATGVFIVCWVPMITMLIVEKPSPSPLPQRSPLYFWFETLALSNSAMNFVIYSARIVDFKDAYVDIFRKMFCL